MGPGSPRELAPPRAKDPKHQKTFEILLSFNEAAQKRSHYRFRRDKLKRDQMRQQRWVDKQAEKEDDFPGRADYELAFNRPLNKDMDDLSKKLADSDKGYFQEAERIAALIDRGANSTQSVTATAETPSASTEVNTDLAEIKKMMDTLVKDNAELKQTCSVQGKQIVEQAEALRSLREEHKTGFKDINALKSELETVKFTSSDVQSLKRQLDGQNEQNSARFSKLDTKFAAFTNALASQKKEQAELKVRIDRLINEQPAATAVRDQSQETTVSQASFQALEEKHKKLSATLEQYPHHSELDEIANYWSENNIGKTFARPEKLLEKAQEEIKAIQESVAQLKLVAAQAPTAFSDDQKAYIKQGISNAESNISAMLDSMISVWGRGMDELREDIDHLKQAGMTQDRSKSVTTSPDISNSETTTSQAIVTDLSKRVDMLEKQGFPEKVSHLENLGGQVQERIQDHQQQIEALQLSTKTLDTQWSNMQSKAMAEHILAQLNPYGQKQQNMYLQLQAQVKDLSSVVSRAFNSSKRPASPANGMNGPAKRQRVEGGVQQQSRPSPSSRQSSLSHETGPLRDQD